MANYLRFVLGRLFLGAAPAHAQVVAPVLPIPSALHEACDTQRAGLAAYAKRGT